MPMPYWKRLIYESWISTWELVVGQPLSRLIILGAIVLMTVVVYRRWKRIEDFWAALRASTAIVISSAVAFAVIFIWNVLFITPKKLVEQADADKKTAEAAAEQLRSRVAAPSSTPMQLDIREHGVDAESREQIASLKKQLDTANETIRQLDPARRPIASASFSVELQISYTGSAIGAHFMDRGAAVGFGRGSEQLLGSFSIDSYGSSDQDGHANYMAMLNSPLKGSVVGKPLTELAQAEYLQIELVALPPNAGVISGNVVVTLNGTEQVQFPIPAQTADGIKVFVRDLYPLRKKLAAAPSITQPSPTPNTAASPP